MKLTADTITDEQIRELLATAGADELDRHGHHLVATCREALGEVHLHGSTHWGARNRCAEILNARQRGS